jgi:DNA-binding GntR family transcriptional regulator
VTQDSDRGQRPIEREVLSEVVKDRILTQILQGDLAPGSRIVETRVARELGTSQAPVREALRDLATLGFIEMKPHRGSWVRTPSKEEMIEAIAVRAELEALAGSLAAVHRSDRCVRDLERLMAEMMEAAERGDPHDQALKNTQFHERILESAGNKTLQHLWSMLEPFARTYVTASAEGMDLHWLGQRHQGILDAIRDQDAELAAELSRAHAAQAAALLEKFEHPELEDD